MADKPKTPRLKKAASEKVVLDRAVTAEQLRDKGGHFTDDVSADTDGTLAPPARAGESEAVTHRVKATVKVYHIVNPGGAVHDVTKERARELLREVGWRLATPAEVAELKKRGGHQTADDPICKPFAGLLEA